MKNYIWKFGLISGLCISLFMGVSIAICYYTNKFGGSMIVGYTAMIVCFSFIFVAVKNYRDKHRNGVISFGDAFKMGLAIALIGSTIYVLAWAFDYNVFFPDFMEKYAAIQIHKAQPQGPAAVAEVKKQMDMFSESYRNPVLFALWTYAEILPVGLLVSLIAALILKRKKGNTQTA